MGRYNMRFRRSVGFGKWFRLNFGKKGMSVSAGAPGARRTWHTSGRRTTTFGVPGSGISWTKIETPAESSQSDDGPPAITQREAAPPPKQNPPVEEPSDLELLLKVRDEIGDE